MSLRPFITNPIPISLNMTNIHACIKQFLGLFCTQKRVIVYKSYSKKEIYKQAIFEVSENRLKTPQTTPK
jgi:hypothetical protein